MTAPVSVTAAQLVYTSVEKSHSPRKVDGWQVLFHTRGGVAGRARLDEDDVQQIEDRVNIYQPRRGGDPPPKHLFFPLPSGKVVLARSVPVTAKDKGRPGVYLTHALIFTAKGFQRLDDNPFAVLSQFRFMKSQEEAYEQGDLATGHIPATDVQVSPPEACRLPLPDQELHRLLFLACQARGRLQRKEAITLLGSPPEMIRLLCALFVLIPPPLRVHCSFDTLFDGGLNHQPYWAVGLAPEDPDQRNMLCFDLERRVFDRHPPLKPEGYFQRWLCAQENRPLAEWGKSVPGQYWLGEWLNTSPGDAAVPGSSPPFPDNAFDDLPHPVAAEFVRKYKRQILAKLTQSLVRQVGKTLGEDEILLRRAHKWLWQKGKRLFLEIDQAIPLNNLMLWLLECFQPGERTGPGREALKELKEFLRGAESEAKPEKNLYALWRRLSLLYCLWCRDWRGLQERLAEGGWAMAEWLVDWVVQPLVAGAPPPPRLSYEFRKLELRQGLSFSFGREDEGAELIRALLEMPDAGGDPADLLDRWRWLVDRLSKPPAPERT